MNDKEEIHKSITPFNQDGVGNKGNSMSDISLLCNTCSEAFKTPWDLMVHAQSAHSMHIFECKNDEDNNDDDESIAKENIGVNTNLNSTNETFSTAISNYHNEIPLHQQQSMVEQSFLPHSQQSATVGDRSH